MFDRDGDGDSDVYLATNPYGFRVGSTAPYDIVLDNAGGTFTPVATVPGTGYASAIKAADLDGDGDQDVLLGNEALCEHPQRRRRCPWFGTSARPASRRRRRSERLTRRTASRSETSMATERWTCSRQLQHEPCVLYLNTGGATFTAVTQTFLRGYTAAGDLNNDGMTDLVVDWRVYFSGGGGTFIAGPLTCPSSLVAPAVLVDVDLDGDLDLVETPARVSLNLGGGTFGAWNAILPQAGYNPTFADPRSAVVDLDSDGDADIVAPGPIIVTNVMRQIALGSCARLGRPASIDLYGTPAASWMLYASNGTASFPLPPFGNVLIDPTSAFLFATGAFTPARSRTPAPRASRAIVPNDPLLVGWTSYWQAVDMTALETTNRLTITVQSY